MKHDTNAISDLPGLGPKSESLLREVGVLAASDLKELGSIAVFMRLKQAGLAPSMNMLYALEGAITDRSWQEIAQNEKHRLLTMLESYKEQEL